MNPVPQDDARPVRLHTYLGMAPGVGKTYSMLAEAWRRLQAGDRVVVGWIERHGRTETRRQLGDLEVVPPALVPYRDATFEDMDVAAVIASDADVVVVDELAHTRPDGARRRWEDVGELLDAGLTVLTTANVANLLSVREYAAQITGVGTVEFVPDEVVRSGEVVLVTMPPEALRQRIAAGNVYSTERVGGALADYFRSSNLEALAELGRAWVDGTLDQIGPDLLARHGVLPALTPAKVVAGISGSRSGDAVIRRAAEIARDEDAELLVAHVDVIDATVRHLEEALEHYRELTSELGGTFVELRGSSVPEALSELARSQEATVVVVARHRSRLGERLLGSVATRLRRSIPGTRVEVAGGRDGSA
jgi:two-component system, OmpR family, sensor histidine kinase KdpD